VLALAVIAGVIFYAMQSRGVHITVRNTGKTTIRNAIIHVTGNSHSLGDLAPGEARTAKVSPRSESHVEVEFTDLHNRSVRLNAGGYFEPGYQGAIEVEVKDGEVARVKDTIRLPDY
jgi:hypothetical protein